MDDVILASDVVMVARGDLGVEIGDPELVGIQKALIRRARQLNRAVITATQMMESMITNPMPTRAEVMDVANAVLDGTDAVMLSAETAAGQYPSETVAAMARVCLGAEKSQASTSPNTVWTSVRQRGRSDCHVGDVRGQPPERRHRDHHHDRIWPYRADDFAHQLRPADFRHVPPRAHAEPDRAVPRRDAGFFDSRMTALPLRTMRSTCCVTKAIWCPAIW
jgi:hypothetical protein